MFLIYDYIHTPQKFQDILPVLAELRHAQDMQVALETHVNEGNFFKVTNCFFYIMTIFPLHKCKKHYI